ncbi:MAG: nucleotide-binding protein [Bacteroidota bacterium]
MEKPKVFIGSSVEGLNVAEEVFAQIMDKCEVTMWKHGLFLPGLYPMEVLEKQLKSNQFAILVATPDDKLEKRSESFEAMRDNVLFEFGLFTGLLGRKRTFLLMPKNSLLNIPSDLAGLMPAFYEEERINSNIEAAIEESVRLILKAIDQEYKLLIECQKSKENELLQSDKGQAIKHLYQIAIRIRDIILVLQNDIVEAISDKDQFENIKENTVKTLKRLLDEYKRDAELINLFTELKNLFDVTELAIRELPYPQELSPGVERLKQDAIRKGFGALDTFLKGGDAFGQIRKEAESGLESRIISLKSRFGSWWGEHSKIIQKETNKLQDAILRESLKLSRNL